MKTGPLDLGMVGNCSFSALVDRGGRIVWCCLPRFDSDPVFHRLLGASSLAPEPGGYWEIELCGQVAGEQEYLPNTAVLVTRLRDASGNAVEITDFAPRFLLHGRQFRPTSLVRRVRPLSGAPRIRVRIRPAFEYGAVTPQVTHGSNHIRFVGPGQTLRVTTNAPISYLLEERHFLLEEPASFLFGADETPEGKLDELVRVFQENTESYWREWTRRLALPLEWQEAVIRAAITLKLCTFEETGAIVAAMTTSIPEAPGTQRNWDYRYCWLRDAFFVVRALNSLAEVETMEHYLRYLHNVAAAGDGAHLQPVYGITLASDLTEREVPNLAGFEGHQPIRVGNQAHEHLQHDVYGNVILAAAQSFFDCRLLRPSSVHDLPRFERVGEQAWERYPTADAGMWELRTRARVHTSSVLMCWAACDRLANIARHVGAVERADLWTARAATIRAAIDGEAWNEGLGAYVDSFGGADVDAGLLLMPEVGFLEARDPRFLSTLAVIEKRLRKNSHLYRYRGADDFGEPRTAFNACTFWYIDALVRVGRAAEAREMFENMLQCRNHVGLLAEDSDVETGEQWGNYPQTYSHAGIINAAVRLSGDWESVV